MGSRYHYAEAVFKLKTVAICFTLSYDFLFFPVDFDANNIFKAFFGGPGGFSFEGRWKCPSVGFGSGKYTNSLTGQPSFPKLDVLFENSIWLFYIKVSASSWKALHSIPADGWF